MKRHAIALYCALRATNYTKEMRDSDTLHSGYGILRKIFRVRIKPEDCILFHNMKINSYNTMWNTTLHPYESISSSITVSVI